MSSMGSGETARAALWCSHVIPSVPPGLSALVRPPFERLNLRAHERVCCRSLHFGPVCPDRALALLRCDGPIRTRNLDQSQAPAPGSPFGTRMGGAFALATVPPRPYGGYFGAAMGFVLLAASTSSIMTICMRRTQSRMPSLPCSR
jgi:hypothetical protein